MQVDSEFKFEPIGFEAKYKNARIFYFTGDFKFAQSQLDVLKQSTSKLIANDAMKLSLLITDNFGMDSNYVAMKLFANADMLLEQHLYEQSFKIYDSIAQKFPTSGLLDEIDLRKATAYMEQGNWDKAIFYLNDIVSYHADDILIDDALYNLGKIYEEHKSDTTKALEYYKKILFEHPESLYNSDVRERIRKLRGDS
jgi:tetratricopeptide (TPR) repeat protein